MSLGTNPENFPIVFLLILAVFPGVILWISIGGFLMRLLRIQNSFLTVVFIATLLIGPILGASLYLDMVGTVVMAHVQTRTERIHYREEGDWSHDYSIAVQYTIADQPPAHATFDTNAAVFDEIHEGDTIDVRAVDINHWFSYMRLANQSTVTWIRWDWIGIGLVMVSAGWLLWKLTSRTRWGWTLTTVIVLALIISPVVFKLLEWERSLDASLTPLRTTATVQEVKRVTWLDPLPSSDSSGDRWETGIDVPQPYDIVVVRFTPQGHEQPVLGVDVVDDNNVVVKDHMPVEVAYAATEPRTVRLLNASRSHYWKNPIGWFQQQLAALALVLLIIGGLSWLGYLGKKWFETLVDQRLSR